MKKLLLASLAVAALLAGATTPHDGTPATSTIDVKPSPSVSKSASAPAPVTPISLADADGQELVMEDLSVRVAVHGMLSLTELDIRFRNPQSRRIEGRFACMLPAHAAISRFAKDVNGQLMEGEVVERLRANQVYEQFLHQMRDPALLEQDQGNRFSARIFPIDPNASVRVLVSYTTLLPLRGGARAFSLPLRGLPKIGRFKFRGFLSPLPGEVSDAKPSKAIEGSDAFTHTTTDVLSIDESDYTPAHDIELTWRPSADAPRARLLRAGDFYLGAFTPNLSAGLQRKTPHAWHFFIDTSASSAEGSEHRIRALEQLLDELPADDSVQLTAFDQELAPLGSGTASAMSRKIGSLLRARLFLGGTDLGGVFHAIASDAEKHPDRVFVVASDLVPTLGTIDRKELNDAIRSIPANAIVHALILGARQDAATSRALTAGHGRVVEVPFSESLDVRARDAAAALQRPLGRTIEASDATAEWLFPSRVEDVQPGDEIIVIGKTKAGARPALRVAGLSAGEASLPIGTFGPLLEREGYRAYLDYLADREANEPDEAVRRALGDEQVKVSVAQRVVIPRTTMLVLESEWDYQRFGLDRRALAQILTIDGGGIGRADRPEIFPTVPVPTAITKQRRIVEPPVSQPEPDFVKSESAEAKVAPADIPTEMQPAPPLSFDEAPKPVPVAGAIAGQADGSATAMQGGVVTGVEAEKVLAAPPPSRQVPMPSPRVARMRRIERDTDTSWIHPHEFDRDDAADLVRQLKENPRDRALYNELSEVLASLGEWDALRDLALRWQPYDPENPQVYEILGRADEKLGNDSEAARANASIIEVAPAKPELLQRAGLLLVRDHLARLAEAPLRRALELRPDRVNSYRHLALMLWLDGRPAEAAAVLESATQQTFPAWYGDAQRVVREELGYVYRAWMAKDPSRKSEIAERARDHRVDLSRHDALRVTLAWETDANDVDLHVVDPDGEECYYSHTQNRSGLTLYEDITQGLGPEVIRTSTLQHGTYHIGVKYFASGPMGVSRGIVVVMRGEKEPSVDIYPFRLLEGGSDIRYVASVAVK